MFNEMIALTVLSSSITISSAPAFRIYQYLFIMYKTYSILQNLILNVKDDKILY